jgi:hypothetical protein
MNDLTEGKVQKPPSVRSFIVVLSFVLFLTEGKVQKNNSTINELTEGKVQKTILL